MNAITSSDTDRPEGTFRVLIWDLPVRVFHWALVASFAGAYWLSESERLRNFHVMFGYTVLGLIAFRLTWGFVGTRYARFRSFLFSPREAMGYVRSLFSQSDPRYLGHNPAGSVAIWAILVLAALTGISGYATYNEIGGDTLEEAHEFLANAWLFVVGFHIAGVLLGSLLHRENLVASMITGYKRAEATAGVRGTFAAIVGVVMLSGILGYWGLSLAGIGAPANESVVALNGTNSESEE
ncbi:MAG: cytochrome b/b6 domain-containing protein [Gammaproteobacteria bacterium]|nr:cytochrome b/b6 domain-containing protein [Gammaproteobacteria bacterium]